MEMGAHQIWMEVVVVEARPRQDWVATEQVRAECVGV